MATAGSRYCSTPETTNTNRVYSLLLGPCTDQMRDVLRKIIPPSRFFIEFMKNKDNLRLTSQQRDLILSQNGCYTGNYDDFDFSLLYILLRNICNITPHNKGWGNEPDFSDKCLSANIERMRITRNRLIQTAGHGLSDRDLNEFWTYVQVAIVAIDKYLDNGNAYEKDVQFLRYATMDPEQEKRYTENLRKHFFADQITKERIFALEENIESHIKKSESKIRDLEENIANYREETLKKISHLEALHLTETFCIEHSKEDNEHYAVLWKKGKCLGRGAHGEVYLCSNETFGYRAVKIVKITEIDDKTSEGSLKALIDESKGLLESHTQNYTKQILDGLCFLHEKGYIHRDLKAANILLDIDKKNIKLADFGVSRFRNTISSGQVKTFTGTIYWMSPEMITKEGYGTKTDIWSLACVILEMFTTRTPWSELESQAAIFKIGNGAEFDYRLPEKVSETCRRFLDQCFQRDPVKRPSAKVLVNYAWIEHVSNTRL